jgi:UDP-N-acetylmuramyl pentapeptide phosphotransferase/UDP-N-acetylglucosamine-1-phosphate transferase
MIPMWLFLIFITCTVLSVLLCGVARKLFPNFRSGEYKLGPHRSDLPAGGREIKTIELPLVGGPAFTLAILITGIATGFLLHLSQEQWTLLLLGLGATLGYMIIGFVDDWHKVYSKEGLRERSKFFAVLSVSIAAALLYFFLLPNGRISYSPYIDIPFLGPLLCPAPLHSNTPFCSQPVQFGQVSYFAWLVVLVLMTGFIASGTALSVDFSDGLDGLAGGLVFSAALAFGIIITGSINPRQPAGIVLEILSLLCAASSLGYLPWNWPSSWAARRGTAKRRAKIYMGDSGALALGGMMAMIAIFSRQETLLLMVGGAFVLEGLSALVSTRILTRGLFRKHLQMLRFASSKEYVPHTEFPLPFLATPLHHHFDLIGWDRRRLVYGAWALGACFAALGVMVGVAPETWQRYFGRILVLILAWAVWSSGSWTRRYFVGKHPAEKTRRRRLALFYGYPYRLMGLNMCHLVEVIEANEEIIETPAEEAALWQRMNIFDARAMLGLYCYRAGYYPAALAQWSRIPESNRALRPEIAHLLAEVSNRIELEKQETQPILRDQILRSEPIISGNLPPADLPNPFEPIRNEEKMDGSGNWIEPPPVPSYNGDDDGNDNNGNAPTSPLQNDILTVHAANSAKHTNGSTGYYTTPPTISTNRNWLSRLLHLSPDKA